MCIYSLILNKNRKLNYLLCYVINYKNISGISIKRFYYRSEAFLSRLSNNNLNIKIVKINFKVLYLFI